MKKHFLKTISLILVILTLCAISSPAFAQEEEPEKNITEFSILCLNVAGLPIPSAFNDEGRVVPEDEKELGRRLNESGYDIICVQEDFQWHDFLSSQMTNYKYKSSTSGGVPEGDGLNIFSKYPFYNVDRVAWNVAYGVLTAGCDELTPKGFMKVTVDIDGVLVDLYNLHVDAYGSDEDCLTKKQQFIQLSDYMNENSKGRPIIITGDYNVTLHSDDLSEFYEIIIEKEGFSDAWSEIVNGGNYLHGEDRNELINRYYTENNGAYWGIWDSVERFIYKDGDGAILTPKTFEYEPFRTEEGRNLTDHCACKSYFEIDRTDYVKPDTKLSKPFPVLFIVKAAKFIACFFKDLYLILKDLPNVINK